MSKWPEDFTKYVLDDLGENAANRRVVKAGLIERCMQRHCDPHLLHANPEDEFTHEDVGPNFGIIGNYVQDVLTLQATQQEIFKEPLIVEKLEDNGYILLNGHHRWFACLRTGIKKVHIQIVNLVNAEDMSRMLSTSTNDKRVSFDLVEVLMAKSEEDYAVIKDNLFSRRIKERLRKGAPEIITYLREKGYDVWVYTAKYDSEEYIRDFFSMYELEIDGVVNGFNDKRKNKTAEEEKVRTMMAEKYKFVLHIDNDDVINVNLSDKAYEQFDIFENADEWQNGIMKIIDNKIQ